MMMMMMMMTTTLYELSERLQISAYKYIDKYNNMVILLVEVMLWRKNSASHFPTNYPRICHVHCSSQ